MLARSAALASCRSTHGYAEACPSCCAPRAAAARSRPEGRLEGDQRQCGVLPSHQGDSQRASGRFAGAEQRRPGRLRDCARENARGARRGYDYIIVHDPQPPRAQHSRQSRRSLGLALPHRHVRTQPGDLGLPATLLAEFARRCSRCRSSCRPTSRSPASRASPRQSTPQPKNLTSICRPRARSSTGSAWICRGGWSRRFLALTRGRIRWGVLAAYRLVREEIPSWQLALVGSMALDDPEGWESTRRSPSTPPTIR